MKSSLVVALSGTLVLMSGALFAHAQDKDDPKSPPADVTAVAKGNNEFAFDLYARLRTEKGNVIFSPYSIETALAMTYAGARGKTADEMAKTLHFTLPQERLHPAFGGLIQRLQPEKDNPSYRLETANAVWPREGLPIVKAYQRLVRTHYGAEVTAVDYARDPKSARGTINRWVAERTNNKIKELLTDDEVNQKTLLVLTNAAYLKAGWLEPFPKDETKDEEFEVAPGKSVKVPMMHNTHARCNFYMGDDFQVLELPYAGERLSLVILLPSKKGRLAELENGLKAAKVEQLLSKLRVHDGKVAMPRFKTEFRRNLVEDLTAMGMPLACSEAADFSGMSKSFAISWVVHQALISVDEEGTEAAAATGIGRILSRNPPFDFRADHPFLFLLRDKETGAILFMGRMAEFKAEKGAP
jgi:serpin B